MGTLTDAEKIEVRRFCGYPVAGGMPGTFTSYRFFTAYGTLEFRLNNMASGEETVLRAKLAILETLETAISDAGDGLDIAVAAVYTRNKNEISDRVALFNYKRRELCEFIGVPPYGPLADGAGGSVRVIV